MIEWKELGNIATFLKGRSLSKNDIGLGDSKIILYGELYTTYGDYITSIKSNTSSDKAAEATKLEYNDLVLPVSSTTKEAQIGKVSVIKEREEVSLGSDAIILRNVFNADYLMYYLNSSLFEKEKMKCVHGTTIMHLSPKELAQKQIPIPPITEQTRIVGILNTFTATIENIKTQIAERRKQYMHYRDKLLELEGKEGVEIKKLSNVCDIKGRIGFRGYTRDDQVVEGEGVISLSPGNIEEGKIYYDGSTFITWEKYYESPEIMIFNDDIIFCKTGSTVGKVAIVENLPYEATINPQLVVLKKVTINPRYLKYSLGTYRTQSVVKRLAGVGSVPNISQEKLSNLEILLPSLEEQSRIVSILETFEASISNLEAQLKEREKQYEYYRNKLLTFD